MTILGWQLNTITWSDAAFHFVLGYQIVNFCILVVPFNKASFFVFVFVVVANSGYFTIFTPHIYFIILISMIAGNLVEIWLPKIQSRKCLRKSNLNEITGDHANENYEVNMWSKYCKISRICNNKKNTGALLKGTTNMWKLTIW